MKNNVVRGVLYVFLLVQALGVTLVKASDATDAYIKKCVEEEIDKQVAHRVEKANHRIANLKNDIRTMVSSEVKRQVADQPVGASAMRSKRCSEYRKDPNEKYILPYWPYYSQFYRHPDFFQFTFMFETASESYSSTGRSQDVFNMHCNSNCIRLKDILLVSKLANLGKLKTARGLTTGQLVKDNHFLSFMANERIFFDASQDFFRGNFNWARHYWDGDVSIGVHIPIAIKRTKLKICAPLTAEIKEKIANVADGKQALVGTNDIENADTATAVRSLQSVQFFKLYTSFEDFVHTILDKKKITPNRSTTSLELGDIGLYANFNIHSRYYQEGVIGLNLVLPSAQRTDGFTLFDPSVGNNGVTQLSAFASFLWTVRSFFNPHIHFTGTYSFPARMRKRVPMVKTRGNPDTISRDLLCGENLMYTDQEFTELDSTVCGFANMTSKVKVSPGPELLFRVGNVFEHFGHDGVFLDIYYDFFAKSKDSHSKTILDGRCQNDFACSFNLDSKTWQVRHRLGADLSYQCNDVYRFRLGVFYNIAGRNVPKTLGVAASINVNFA